MNGSEWNAYEKLVMDTLENLETDVTDLREEIVLLRIDVAQLKIKAGIWGAIAGMIPALLASVALFVGGGG